ncbi:hypothetical protein ACFQ1E_11630 [Sphingomonas canadensis]|uniref:Lysoplasmalogenase n=1 Tax=Sphingomonas canadensis TaxID=1219257 RepID=A0ABW3H8F9_9SPHN|nr:hypothetical protein [Sphingomonas canadensis]MCW3836875.1 hypothetical protein [Sphingomonas canadensis]
MDLPFLAFCFGMAAVMTAASLTVIAYPDVPLARGALVVFVNWVLGTVFALSTNITDGWWFNILIDLASAVALLRLGRGRWQVGLGLTYCIQLCGHLFYALTITRGQAAAWPYYSWLTAIAWLQLLLVAGWAADVWWRSSRAARAQP